MGDALLVVEGLEVTFQTEHGPARAVDGASLAVEEGEAVALVGESGCGKTVSALAVLNLLFRLPGASAEGSVRFRGRELLGLPERAMRSVRGAEIAMVFQEPGAVLDPVLTIGDHIVETIRAHEPCSKHAARQRAADLLDGVGLPNPAAQLDWYPHQFSGGMQQRAVIAMALACGPSLLLADEPTTALDVTVQARILGLLDRLRRVRKMALLLITHDLAIVAQVAERAVVMYAGKVVECAPVQALFARPGHPYTLGLMQALPSVTHADGRLYAIPGEVPDPAAPPPGCRFAPRCPRADAGCRQAPPWVTLGPAHGCLCWKAS
jgi:oligopeptide/dipeptide ABC transporter ATP-binding protein